HMLLQKKDNEGFGFVLRGAKAQTPIEEFTPTPAFPALQYLESVDEGGVAWRAGLRMGDFLIEVNGQNVVKVGHRQVVNMIRQGGNSLMVKVVMVARNPELEDTVRKRGESHYHYPTKRLTPPAIALRSKSMTSELEDMAGGRSRQGDGEEGRPRSSDEAIESGRRVEAAPRERRRGQREELHPYPHNHRQGALHQQQRAQQPGQQHGSRAVSGSGRPRLRRHSHRKSTVTSYPLATPATNIQRRLAFIDRRPIRVLAAKPGKL
uniref:PDZ domain-containing protein n=1 Tax=Labrus bergylta TaxID=56723 RepID=A0A3Q3FPF5_9LABR